MMKSDPMNDERCADICLVVEGCYPYVAGGVSSWLDWLIREQRSRSFAVLAITADESIREFKFELPENVVDFRVLPLNPSKTHLRTGSPKIDGLAYGAAGFSHHAIEDLAIMRALPGIVVSAPADAYETDAVTRLAAKTAGPFFVRIGKNNEPDIHGKPCSFGLGELIIHRKDGYILLVSTGTLLNEVIEAATLLEEKGLQVAVVGIPFLRPLDEESFKEILLGKRVVFTVEEHTKFGGLGSVLSEIIADNNLNVPLYRIYLPEFIDQVGSQHELRRFYKIDKEGIASKTLEFMNQIQKGLNEYFT